MGAGCGAQAPYPSLNLSAVPSTGATFDMLVSGAPPFSQATALLSHLPENAPVQLSNNCLGYLSPAAGTLGTFSIDASGNGVLPVPIPNIPGLAGMELSVQVFFDTPLPTATQAYNFRVTQ